MGKGHQHMKKLKSEKAKVKLKGSKHLPKGTNVTDTSFKIKQIVIREQLKAANEADHLSKRKLNVKVYQRCYSVSRVCIHSFMIYNTGIAESPSTLQ